MKKIIQRAESPTPPFFCKLRNMGIVLAAVSAAMLTAPVSLPVIVTTMAGYLAVARTVAGAISQLTLPDENKKARIGRKKA